jgi:hypothetical protein
MAVASPVVLTVRENTRHSGPDGQHLRHAVPPVDVVSGKNRKHAADMGLCEVPAKSDPLHLGEPVDLPPNCQSCLDYAAKIRDKDAPAPPTAAEATLMRLIASGAVFTMQPARSQPTIRDTSHRSRETRGGALGRKVDARVKALQAKGWAAPDSHHSETQTGHRGHLWRLTAAGTTALEG